MTQKEFIIPLDVEGRQIKLFRDPEQSFAAKVKETIPSLERSVSIRPDLVLEEK